MDENHHVWTALPMYSPTDNGHARCDAYTPHVLRFERDAWSMGNLLRDTRNEYAPPNGQTADK